MKITTTNTVIETKEVEISLPYFFTTKDNYYAVLSEKVMLVVTYLEYGKLPPSVWITSRSVDIPANHKEITAKEFEAMFDKANDYIADNYEAMRDVLRERTQVYANFNGEGDE